MLSAQFVRPAPDLLNLHRLGTRERSFGNSKTGENVHYHQPRPGCRPAMTNRRAARTRNISSSRVCVSAHSGECAFVATRVHGKYLRTEFEDPVLLLCFTILVGDDGRGRKVSIPREHFAHVCLEGVELRDDPRDTGAS